MFITRNNLTRIYFRRGVSRFLCTKNKPSTEASSSGIMDQASIMERSVMRTLRVRSQNRFRMGVAFAFVAGVVGYAFYPDVKSKTSSEIAEVAGGVIQDAEVQKKAETLATAVVHTVLNDPSVLKIAARFVGELARDPELQRVAAEEGAKISRHIVKQVLDDPETTRYVVKVLQRASKDPETQTALLELSYWLLEQEPVRQQLVKLTNGVMVDPSFLKESAALGTWISHQVLDDEAVYNHSCDFCMAVLSDPTLQQTAGNALWESVKGIVSPTSWIFGTAPPSSSPASPSSSSDENNGEDSSSSSSSNEKSGSDDGSKDSSSSSSSSSNSSKLDDDDDTGDDHGGDTTKSNPYDDRIDNTQPATAALLTTTTTTAIHHHTTNDASSSVGVVSTTS